MKRKLIIGCGFVLLALSAQAQVKERKVNNRIGIEMGFHEFFGSTIVPDRVRTIKSVDAYETGYYDDYYGGCYYYSYQAIHKIYVGIKYEALFFKNSVGVSSGLRYYQTSSQLDHNKNYDSFIWLLREEEQSSDYVSLRSLNQKNHYVSLPLEFRVFPRKRDSFFKHYFKIGGAFSYRFSTNYKIDFLDPQMSKYADEIEDQILKPCTFSGFFFPAFGFRWGRNKDPWFNMEFQFPGFIIAQRKHAFVDPDVGLGMQFSVLLPLK